MTPDDLDRLRKLAAEATPGPWKYMPKICTVYAEGTRVAEVLTAGGPVSPLQPDGLYIAAANPATVLALLDRIKELEAARSRAVAEERERCARVAESYFGDPRRTIQVQCAGRDIAAAIRTQPGANPCRLCGGSRAVPASLHAGQYASETCPACCGPEGRDIAAAIRTPESQP